MEILKEIKELTDNVTKLKNNIEVCNEEILNCIDKHPELIS